MEIPVKTFRKKKARSIHTVAEEKWWLKTLRWFAVDARGLLELLACG